MMITTTTAKKSITAALLFLLPILPFLSWIRYQPSGDYISQLLTALLIVPLLLLPVITSSPRLLLPKPMLLLALLPVLMMATSVLSPYPGQVMVAAVALILILFLACFVASQPAERVTTILAWALLLGGCVQLLVGVLQVTKWVLLLQWPWVFYDKGNPANLIGQIAQRNHYANYLMLSLMAGCYLFARGLLSRWLLLPVALLAGLLMAWSGSRLAIAYGGAAMVLVWLFYLRSGRQAQLGRFAAALALAVCWLVICQLYIKEIAALLAALGLPFGEASSAADRMMAGGFGGRRWVEWQKAWQVFLANPWVGVGFGGYAAQSVRLEVAMGFAGQWSESWLFTHSHNLFMQLLAESGLLGTLLAVGGVLWAFLPFFRKEQANLQSLLVVLLAMVLLMHSMVEYPLWYLSFLGVFGILLGLSPVARIELEIRPAMRRVLALGLAALVLWQAVLGLMTYQKLVLWVAPGNNAQLNVSRAETIWSLGRNPVWTYETDMVLSGYLLLDKRELKAKRALFERLVSYRPHVGVLTDLAVLRALDGDRAEALQALQFAIAAYPDYAERIAARLATHGSPEVAPLRVLAGKAAQAAREGGVKAAAASMLQSLPPGH